MSNRSTMLSDVDANRFPALGALFFRRRTRVELVQQMEAADCGAACLSMALRFHGCKLSLSEVRKSVAASASGASAQNLVAAAKKYGLSGRGVRCEIDDFKHLPAATILHWEFNHFVVLERVSTRGVHIVDPALGRRCISFSLASQSFTGVAIELSVTDTFLKNSGETNITWSFMRELIASSGGIYKILTISLLMQLFALAVPVLTGVIVDRVIPRADSNLLFLVGLGLGTMVLFQSFSTIIRSHLLLQMRTNLDTKMTLGFLQHLVSLPYEFYQRRSAGDLLMRVSSNQTIREILTSQTLSAFLDGLLVIVYLGLIVLADSLMAFVLVTLAMGQVLIMLLSKRKIQELEAQSLAAGSRSQSSLVQMISGIATLKLAGAEHRAVQKWSHHLTDTLNVGLDFGRTNALIGAFLGGLQSAAPMIILSIGAIRVMGEEMSLGTMLAVNALGGAFLGPVSNLVESMLSLQRVRGHLERIEDVLDVEPEQKESQTQAPRLRGQIELRNVTFRYGEKGAAALDDVSLRIESGSSVAIVGSSGSGKSTLANLLLGLHGPESGSVYYDNNPLEKINLQSLRSQLGVVPQEPFFFDTSVRDNIALVDPDASLERVMMAAKTAGIHHDIEKMSMGYETLLSDRGHSMSGGQRQRLALARALLARPSILLLDEATSALDTETEAKVVQNLERLRMTRVFIAHRLSTVRNADQIIVMDEGRIVETGTHTELLLHNHRYAQLVRAQLND